MALAESAASTSTSSSSAFSPAPSDILKDVVAYVEVRTASDNRSAAVTHVLTKMGARVEEKFTNNVTHVIFKEGKKRTRDKALKLGVHLVSVLWVDRCKELQHKVPESDFVANTERCGTPPPGIRWKKYKSMQPRDFEDDLARSAERCQKRRRKVDKYKLLLQGSESNTPLHSPSNVLVVDTQPRSPFALAALGFNFESPVIIPSTPPSMQARLDQLKREKEARKQREMVESPLCATSAEEVPLQRILFTSQTPPQRKEMVAKPAPSRRSSRLSGRVVIAQESSQETAQPKPQTSSCSNGNAELSAIQSLVSRVKLSSSSESSVLDKEAEEKFTSQSRAKVSVLQDKPPAEASGVLKKKYNRQSLGSILSLSQDKKLSSCVIQTRAHNRRSLGGNLLPKKTHSLLPSNVNLTDGSEKEDRNEENSSAAGEDSSCDNSSSASELNSKHKQGTSSSRQTLKKCAADDNIDMSSSAAESSSEHNTVEKDVPETAKPKPTARKRKLLNPSQDLHILSPSSEENANLPRQLSADVSANKRGKKRKSCAVDAVFPSTAPTSMKVHSSSKENKGKRKRRSSDRDSNISEEGLSETGTRKPAKRGKVSHRETKDMSASASTLASTSHTSSMLGSSMSVMFNDTSTLGSTTQRFAPPRNSIAEFKVRKPNRQGRRKIPQETKARGRNSDEDQKAEGMSLQKFCLSSMPSLVMTSLHRPEQEEVIVAVKKLGVFKVEDKVSKDTTHVVYGEPRRTLNVLQALARGCWLVSKQWVVDSVQQKQWVSEGEYEAVEEYCKAKEARLEREAEAPGSYQCRIFETAGSLFVSNTCTPPRSQLIKLLHLCGAKVTDSIQRADFYIGDQSHDEKISVKPVWVLDCISQQKLLPMNDYVLAINFKPKSSSSPEY